MLGKTSKLGNMLKQGVKGVMSGALVGSHVPPPGICTFAPMFNCLGMIAGGIIGGVIGTLGGFLER